METTLTKLAIMTASARVDLQVTTRRRHEFQWLDLRKSRPGGDVTGVFAHVNLRFQWAPSQLSKADGASAFMVESGHPKSLKALLRR
jgi:hypothetical protein